MGGHTWTELLYEGRLQRVFIDEMKRRWKWEMKQSKGTYWKNYLKFFFKDASSRRELRIHGNAVATFGSAGKELRIAGKGMGLGRIYNAVITRRKWEEFPRTRDSNISWGGGSAWKRNGLPRSCGRHSEHKNTTLCPSANLILQRLSDIQ